MVKELKPRSSPQQIDQFLNKARDIAVHSGTDAQARLIFGLDATASRQPTWDHASHLQQEMFLASRELKGLSVQLCYYRGFNEFSHSQWLQQADAIQQQMAKVSCLGGHTQIRKLLRHALKEAKQQKVHAVIFIGDAIEEDVDNLCQLAGQLGVYRVPVFTFQEGNHPEVRNALQQIAHLSGGAYAVFDQSSPETLKALLGAVAVYASGGYKALQQYSENKKEIKLLTQQMNR